jgi:hypothetical protein
MGSRPSKNNRQPDDFGASGSRKASRNDVNKGKAREEETDAFFRDADFKEFAREPLDKRDPWGHMARVVHSRHSSGFDEGRRAFCKIVPSRFCILVN